MNVVLAVLLVAGFTATAVTFQMGLAEAAPSKCYARNAAGKVQHSSCNGLTAAQRRINDKCFLAQTIGGAYTQAGDLGSGVCNSLQRQAQAAPAPGGGAPDEDQTLGAGGTAGCSGTVNLQNCVKNNPIVTKVLRPLVLFLSAVVAIVIIGSLIVAGIQYSAAQDNPQMVQKSKDRIRNALIALGAFMFALAGLQYLIPGGIISL